MEKKKTIMIVDDEEDTRKLASEVISSEGYEVSTAKDGSDCLKQLKKKGPVDLILLDIMMPGMKPQEIIDRISDIPECNDTKISYFSVLEFLEEQKQEMFKDKHVIDYIKKPFTNEGLIGKIRKILR